MNWIFRINLFVFAFIYCLSVFEVNNEYLTNSWGDEFDLYIHCDNSTNHSVKAVKELPAHFVTDVPELETYHFAGSHQTKVESPSLLNYTRKHPGYLLKRALLI